jgi:hypothetical protein
MPARTGLVEKSLVWESNYRCGKQKSENEPINLMNVTHFPIAIQCRKQTVRTVLFFLIYCRGRTLLNTPDILFQEINHRMIVMGCKFQVIDTSGRDIVTMGKLKRMQQL